MVRRRNPEPASSGAATAACPRWPGRSYWRDAPPRGVRVMLTWVIAGSLVLGAPSPKDKPTGQELYGEWVVEAQEENGRARPPEEVPARLRFDKDGTCQVDLGGKGWSEPRG